MVFHSLFEKGKSTSFPEPFLKLREGKGPGTGWFFLQFHWSTPHKVFVIQRLCELKNHVIQRLRNSEALNDGDFTGTIEPHYLELSREIQKGSR